VREHSEAVFFFFAIFFFVIEKLFITLQRVLCQTFMKNRILHIILFSFAIALSAAAQQVTPNNTAKFGVENQQEERVVSVQIFAVNGVLTVKSDEDITKVEVYSPIGGLLYQSSEKNCEIRVDNLPKTILVVRVRVGDNKPIVQKVKMQ